MPGGWAAVRESLDDHNAATSRHASVRPSTLPVVQKRVPQELAGEDTNKFVVVDYLPIAGSLMHVTSICSIYMWDCEEMLVPDACILYLSAGQSVTSICLPCAYMYVHICMHVCRCLCIHTISMQTCTCACVCECLGLYIFIMQTRLCVYAYMH